MSGTAKPFALGAADARSVTPANRAGCATGSIEYQSGAAGSATY